MIIRKFFTLCLLLVLTLVLAACGSKTDAGNAASAVLNQAGSGPVVQNSGPFQAVATSAISVDLSWDAVEGATGYRIENSFADSEWFLIAELGSEQTRYEDFLTPSDMELIYRLTPIMGDHDGQVLSVSISTPEITPNPLTVIATLEEPDYSSVGIDLAGFDASTFDPATFDPSSLDLSAINPADIDLTSLLPEPVSTIALIGPEGGSLSVKGKNGVIYTLEIPPGALDFSTYFVLNPVAGIEAYPFSGGFYGAVQIQPEGIIFDTPVTITIDLPEELLVAQQTGADLQQVAFAYEGSGEEFHLTSFTRDDSLLSSLPVQASKDASPALKSNFKMIIITNNSRSVGMGRATAAEAKNHVTKQPPSNPVNVAEQNRAFQEMVDEFIKDEIKSAEGKRESIVRRATVIYQALKKARNILDYAVWLLELEDFFNSSDYRNLSSEEQDGMMQVAGILLKGWLQPVKCPSTDAFIVQAWARRLLSPVSAFDKELKKNFIGSDPVGGAELLKSVIAVQGCKVQLVLKSKLISGDAVGTCRYRYVVSAIVPLSWKLNGSGIPFLQGGSPAGEHNLAYNQPIEILSVKNDTGWCSYIKIGNLAKSDLTIIRLVPVFIVDGSKTVHKDWYLEAYRVGGKVSSLTKTMKFPDHETTQTQPIPGGNIADPWGGTMVLIATDGVEKPGPLGINHWEISEIGNTSFLAKWTGTGMYTDGSNYHSHETSLWIKPQ